jgi:hypothetical protein
VVRFLSYQTKCLQYADTVATPLAVNMLHTSWCCNRHCCVYRCGVETRRVGLWSHVWWMEYTAPAGLELLGHFLTRRTLLMHGGVLQGAPWTQKRNVFCGDSAFRSSIWFGYPNSTDVCKSSLALINLERTLSQQSNLDCWWFENPESPW